MLDLDERVLAVMHEGSWWWAWNLARRLGVDQRQVLASLMRLRRAGLVASRKPASGKGEYGLRTMRWWATSEGER